MSHKRRGHWVSPHYRDGIFVAGHFRSASTVNDFYVAPTVTRTRSKLVLPTTDKKDIDPLYFGNVTFPTSCWWCNDDVFFHRNKNGGCALFDELGPPWPVHKCWVDNKSEQEVVTESILKHYRAYLESVKKTNFSGSKDSFSTKKNENARFAFTGTVLESFYTEMVKLTSLKGEPIVAAIFFEVDGNIYKLFVPEDLSEYVAPNTSVKIGCITCNRGNGEFTYLESVEYYDSSCSLVAEIARTSLSWRQVVRATWVKTAS